MRFSSSTHTGSWLQAAVGNQLDFAKCTWNEQLQALQSVAQRMVQALNVPVVLHTVRYPPRQQQVSGQPQESHEWAKSDWQSSNWSNKHSNQWKACTHDQSAPVEKPQDLLIEELLEELLRGGALSDKPPEQVLQPPEPVSLPEPTVPDLRDCASMYSKQFTEMHAKIMASIEANVKHKGL